MVCKLLANKKIKIIIIVMMILLTFIVAYSTYGNIKVNKEHRNDGFVYAYKNKLYVNEQLITLNGVNLGGWLVPEGWMTPLLIEG